MTVIGRLGAPTLAYLGDNENVWHYDDMINFASRTARFLRRKKRAANTYYCDYAAATPVLPAVLERMQALQRTEFANPSSIHRGGQTARAVIDSARLELARALTVRPEEITFTASGSEANNLAILGTMTAVAGSDDYSGLRIVTTHIEHPSVHEAVLVAERRGATVEYIPVDEAGLIDVSTLKQILETPATVLTFAYANSEVGTVQPVRRIVRTVKQLQPATYVHIDAAQAPLWLSCNRNQLGVDLLTLDAGKCNGPKGVGILVARAGVPLQPVIHGGGQERGLRPGTENTAGIAGAVLAIVAAQADYRARSAAVYQTTQKLVALLTELMPTVIFNGPAFVADCTKLERLPNNVHISLPGFDTEYAVTYLDTHNIAASTKSACSGAGGGVSTVVYTMTKDDARAGATIRFSLDPELQPRDMPYIAQKVAQFVALQQSVD